MTLELGLLSAFLIGLLGSLHCIGMCGGIVGALTLGVKAPGAGSLRTLAPYLLAYNLGRLASYAAAGALVAWLGAHAFELASPGHARLVARLVSGGFAVALGLYLAGWWHGLAALERAGGRLWRRVEPLGRRWLPVDRPHKALLLGLVWGWLPCGMVYAALAWAAAAGGAAQGAALMAAFGAGTLPLVLTMGAGAQMLARTVRDPMLRRAAGMAIVAFGIYVLAAPPPPAGHAHGAPVQAEDAPVGPPGGAAAVSGFRVVAGSGCS